MSDFTEQIGLLIDKCENYLAATALPVPPQTHVNGLIVGFREVRAELIQFRNALSQTPHENTQLLIKIETLRTALSAVVHHWREFGPEYGFDEIVEAAAHVLESSPKGSSDV